MKLLAILTLAATAALPLAQKAKATTFAVGPASDSACTHTSLRQAMTDAANIPGGPHLIKIVFDNDSSLSYTGGNPDSEFELIDPVARYLTVEGGYASCSEPNPAYGEHTTLDFANPAVDSEYTMLRIQNSGNSRTYITFRNVHFQGAGVASSYNAPDWGGALSVLGNVTVVLDNNTLIKGFRARLGGGVFLWNTWQSGNRPLLQMNPGARIANNVAKYLGGGIASFAGKVYLHGATITSNIAETGNGGGMYLFDAARDGSIVSDPDNTTLTVVGPMTSMIVYNQAGAVSSGSGGGIYSDSAWMWVKPSGTASQHTLVIRANRAKYGGGIYIEGPNEDAGGPFTDLIVHDTLFGFNYASYQGGAVYAMNAVDGEFDSSGERCALDGYTTPCSVFNANRAGNETESDTSPGGGAVYLNDERGDGASRPILRFKRTVFAGNKDLNGSAAVAAVDSQAEFSFHRSIFLDNEGSAQSALIYSDNGKSVDFRYNTVLENDTARALTIFGNSRLYTQGSIIWMPGHDIWSHDSGTYMTHNGCLLVHADLDIPGYPAIGDPTLDNDFTPLAGSPALDYCDSWGYSPISDAYHQGAYDLPDVPNHYSDVAPYAHDLGAVEKTMNISGGATCASAEEIELGGWYNSYTGNTADPRYTNNTFDAAGIALPAPDVYFYFVADGHSQPPIVFQFNYNGAAILTDQCGESIPSIISAATQHYPLALEDGSGNPLVAGQKYYVIATGDPATSSDTAGQFTMTP